MIMRRLILSIIFLLSFSPAIAFAEEGVFLFLGASSEGVPSSARVGLDTWELGELTTQSFGIDKIYRMDWKYMAWGLCIVPSYSYGGGFFAALGMEPKLIWGLTFRGELNAIAASNGIVKGEAHVGFGFHF
jgi:hypothetical protein